MRAVEVSGFGGPEVLRVVERADPRPSAHEAVIAVEVADVLFLETQVRAGMMRDHFRLTPPYVPGDGVVGEVREVGSGVDRALVGRKVAGYAGGQGGYADRVLLDADRLVPVPDGLAVEQAAALLHDGPTALTLFRNAAVKPDERVLITAAGGGMGILLVQLTHAEGAHVIAAARGEEKLRLLRDLGADTVVDYSRHDWARQVRETAPDGVDAVFDGAGAELGGEAFVLAAPGARFSAHGAPAGRFADIDQDTARERDVTVRGIEQTQLGEEETVRLAGEILRDAAVGKLRPVIGQTFPLGRAAEAHAALEQRSTKGKTVLLV
jgi:NADPH:quinone reductase